MLGYIILVKIISLSIKTYNNTVKEIKEKNINKNDIKSNVTTDNTKISWSRALLNSLNNYTEKSYDENCITTSLYRPFCKQWFYYSNDLNECQYKTKRLFKNKNKTIIVTGNSSGKAFSALITDHVFNFHTL